MSRTIHAEENTRIATVGSSGGAARRLKARLTKEGWKTAAGFKPKTGFIYSVTRAISARCNENYDAWPKEELRKSAHTFIGKPVFVNHANEDPEKARGVVVAARYVEADNDAYIEVIQEVDAERFPKLAHELRTGGIDGVSMGAEAAECECSHCGNVATDEHEFCDHVKYRKGEKTFNPRTGKTEPVHEICRKISFFELSFVFDPADPSAVVSKVIAAAKEEALKCSECGYPIKPGQESDDPREVWGGKLVCPDCLHYIEHTSSRQTKPHGGRHGKKANALYTDKYLQQVADDLVNWYISTKGTQSLRDFMREYGSNPDEVARAAPIVDMIGYGHILDDRKIAGKYTKDDFAIDDGLKPWEREKQNAEKEAAREDWDFDLLGPGYERDLENLRKWPADPDDEPIPLSELERRELSRPRRGSADWRELYASWARTSAACPPGDPNCTPAQGGDISSTMGVGTGGGNSAGPTNKEISLLPGYGFDSGGGGGGGSWGSGGSPATPSSGGGGGNVGDNGIMDVSRPLYEQLKQINPDVSIGGYREDSYGEHSRGALDFMTSNPAEANQAINKAFEAGAPWAIWQQQMWYPNGTTSPMPDRGSPTQNHMDHVHTGPLAAKSNRQQNWRSLYDRWARTAASKEDPNLAVPNAEDSAELKGFQDKAKQMDPKDWTKPKGANPKPFKGGWENGQWKPNKEVTADKLHHTDFRALGRDAYSSGGPSSAMENTAVRRAIRHLPQNSPETHRVCAEYEGGYQAALREDMKVAGFDRVAWGEEEAPSQIDTLREEVDDDTEDFQHYLDSPDELTAPDLSNTKRLDREQEEEGLDADRRAEDAEELVPGMDPAAAFALQGQDVLPQQQPQTLTLQLPMPTARRTADTSSGNTSTSGGVPIIQNPDGTWTSPDPNWAALIQRESGGDPSITQQIQDVNSGGNEAEGLFQITPATWAGAGGDKYGPSPGQATPEQQAEIAGNIFRANPSGSDWGAGLPGREDPAGLASALGVDSGSSGSSGSSTKAPGSGNSGQSGNQGTINQDMSAAPPQVGGNPQAISVSTDHSGRGGSSGSSGGAGGIDPGQAWGMASGIISPIVESIGGPIGELGGSLLSGIGNIFSSKADRRMAAILQRGADRGELTAAENRAFVSTLDTCKSNTDLSQEIEHAATRRGYTMAGSPAGRNKVAARKRRQHFADQSRNDQGEQEEVFITQTPSEEPVAAPTQGDDPITNTPSNLVARIRAKSADLARDVAAYRRMASDTPVLADEVDPPMSGTDDQSVDPADKRINPDPNAGVKETQPKDAALHDASLVAFARFDDWLRRATGRTAADLSVRGLKRAAMRYSRDTGTRIDTLFPSLGTQLRAARKTERQIAERQQAMRRRADTSLEVAAPQERIDVEAPVSNTTDDRAQASQYNLPEYAKNAGDPIADPDLSTDQNYGPGQGKQSKKADGILAVRCAEAYIDAGLADPQDKWKLAAQFQLMNRGMVNSHIALCERFASIRQADRQKVASGSTRGTAPRLPQGLSVPPSMARSASSNRQASLTDPAYDFALFTG